MCGSQSSYKRWNASRTRWSLEDRWSPNVASSPPLYSMYEIKVRYPFPVIAALKPRGVWHCEMNDLSPFGSFLVSCRILPLARMYLQSRLHCLCDMIRYGAWQSGVYDLAERPIDRMPASNDFIRCNTRTTNWLVLCTMPLSTDMLRHSYHMHLT